MIVERLQKLKRDADAARDAFEFELVQRVKPGMAAKWRKWSEQDGEVVRVHPPRVMVRNDMTGKEYWIDFMSLIWVGNVGEGRG